MIGDKPMVCHVYDRASEALPGKVWVATDDRRIYDTVSAAGGQAVMTSSDCANGTARCAEAVDRLGLSPDIIANIQGDEPFLNPADINLVISQFRDQSIEIATLARRFNPEEGFEALFCPDTPKVTFTSSGRALYFSRSIIPYVRNEKWQKWIDATDFYIHIGLYAFRSESLAKAITLKEGRLEQAERLEQLRWLEAGMNIGVAVTQSFSQSVDTPDDLEKARRLFTEMQSAR